MNREELQEEIRFLYGLWYRYFNLYHFVKKHKRGLELIPKLREKQNELLRLIDFAKDQLWVGIIMVRNSQNKNRPIRSVPLSTIKKMHENFVHLLILSHTLTSRENVHLIFHLLGAPNPLLTLLGNWF